LEWVVHVHAFHNMLKEAYFPAEEEVEGMGMDSQRMDQDDEAVGDHADTDTLHTVQGMEVVLHVVPPSFLPREQAFPVYLRKVWAKVQRASLHHLPNSHLIVKACMQ